MCFCDKHQFKLQIPAALFKKEKKLQGIRVNTESIGKVKWFDNKKGIGCITSRSGKDLSVHYRDIKFNHIKTLLPKQRVTYTELRDVGGLSAIGVRPYYKTRKTKQAEGEKRKKQSIDKSAAIRAVLIMLASFAVLIAVAMLFFHLSGPLLTILKILSRMILGI